jgi:hypothetical protein
MLEVCFKACRFHEIGSAFIQCYIIQIVFLMLPLQSKITVNRDEERVFVPSIQNQLVMDRESQFSINVRFIL